MLYRFFLPAFHSFSTAHLNCRGTQPFNIYHVRVANDANLSPRCPPSTLQQEEKKRRAEKEIKQEARFCVASVRCPLSAARVCVQPAILRGTAVFNLHYSGIALNSARPALSTALSVSKDLPCTIPGTCTIYHVDIILLMAAFFYSTWFIRMKCIVIYVACKLARSLSSTYFGISTSMHGQSFLGGSCSRR